MDLDAVHVPSYLPDNETVRGDIADYYWEVQRWDSDVAKAIKQLEEAGELDNTIIVMTGDHGWPFPRGKCNLYDSGSRVPLAIRWGNNIKPGRTVTDFTSLTDIAPTLLELAGLPIPEAMTGKSLVPILASQEQGRVDPERDAMVFGRERHTLAQLRPSMAGYPSRALRTDKWLLILNFEPNRWPAGAPIGAFHPMNVHADCDPGPTKSLIIEQMYSEQADQHDLQFDADLAKYYQHGFAKRPAVELYDCVADPNQINNLADKPEFASTVAPFLRQLSSHYNGRPDLSFVDIGGGSGSLLSEVSKLLIESHGALLHNRKFAWSIVDLCLQDTTRRTHSPELRKYMSYIDYQAVDYMAWIAEESIRSDCDRYDVVLICRLLNNLSRINIERSSSSDVATELTRVRKIPTSPNYHPADCLRGTAPDCQSLITSNSRARLLGGMTFRQASLSDYYQGLHLTSERSSKTQNYNGSLFFPLRRFNPDALVLPDGRSILDQLCRMASLIVIEDVDLTAEVLIEHLQSKDLQHLAASDATNRIRMQSASLICVTRRELEAALPGRRIW